MLNLLWLLLPVAAAAGWFAARRSGAARPEAFWDYTANFHKDLNLLLSQRQHLPEELFNELSDTDRDTADTHLALGNLFRRRGEIDKAILLHESLLNKQELGEDVQAAALYELARDYDSAGLLDRSEDCLRQLIDQKQRLPDAYNTLLQLNEREKDWAGAIEVAEEIARVTGESQSRIIAHYYCELANSAGKEGYPQQAQDLLAKALSQSESCARAHMMLAELAENEGEYETALAHYADVEKYRPELLPEIIDSRYQAFRCIDDESRLRSFITHISGRRNAYSVIRSTRAVIEELDGIELADRFFKDQIVQRPSLKGLRDWAHDQIKLSKPGEKDKVQVICTMLDRVVEDKPTYLCNSCGFRGRMLHWHCPSCSNWDSVHTIIGAEGE